MIDEVLHSKIPFPSLVRLVSASCNRAAIRIQWTKLKTVPIQLQLDEIRVTIETCDELRGDNGQTGNGPHLPQAELLTENLGIEKFTKPN